MKQLEHLESQLALSMHPEVAEVLKGKRICLWQEMLQAIDYSDMGVVHELMGSHFEICWLL